MPYVIGRSQRNVLFTGAMYEVAEERMYFSGEFSRLALIPFGGHATEPILIAEGKVYPGDKQPFRLAKHLPDAHCAVNPLPFAVELVNHLLKGKSIAVYSPLGILLMSHHSVLDSIVPFSPYFYASEKELSHHEQAERFYSLDCMKNFIEAALKGR